MPILNKNNFALKVFLGVVILTIVILCALLIQQYEQIQHLNYVVQRHSILRSLHSNGPATAADASSTQVWMTFDYINHVFGLPVDYLQTTLAVTDSRYPRLTIAEYAQGAGVSSATKLTAVQDAIRAYFVSHGQLQSQ